jgi:hypothetical protein
VGNKKPASKISPNIQKAPKVASDPNDFYKHRPTWRVGSMQMVHPYGWHEVSSEHLHHVRERLSHFEKMTWKEILIDGKKFNHMVKVNRLCAPAQARLTEVAGDLDQLTSLRLMAKERVWGILDGSVLQLLWWDPDHEVCPSLLKNT